MEPLIALSEKGKEFAVEYTFTGFWVLVLLVGAVIAWRTASNHNQAYRAFVPLIGFTVVFLLVGSIVLGGVFYPD